MIHIKTDYTRIQVNNPRFQLIYVISKIVSRDTRKLDCRNEVEKQTRQDFLTRYTAELNLRGKKIHWYTQFNPKNFEALIVVMGPNLDL